MSTVARDWPAPHQQTVDIMEPFAFSISQAVQASGGALSRTGLYKAAKLGQLTIRKNSKRSFVLASDLKMFLESLPTANQAKAT